jgi:hypothetical protein
MDPEFLNRLDDSYHAMMKEQELIRNLEDAIDSKIKEVISEFFPDEIQHLSAEGYRELDKVVYSKASAVALKIVNVMYEHTE